MPFPYARLIVGTRHCRVLINDQIIAIATGLLLLTYNYSRKELEDAIDEYLSQLPGGEDGNLDIKLQ